MSEPKLRAPLEPLIDDRAPVRSHEMWRAINDTRAQRQRGKRPAQRQAYALGAACSLMVLAMLMWGLHSAPATEGPLARRDLQSLPARMMPTMRFETLDLSDGSRITVAQHARLDFLASSGRSVSLALREGRARFDVRPHGPRSWRIDCGALEVEVVGTAFTIERNEEEVSVQVNRGAVLVRGKDVPDGVQRLDAGETLKVSSGVSTEYLRPDAGMRPTESPASAPNETASLAKPSERQARPPRPKSSAAEDREQELKRWWREADNARALGRPQQAVEPLEQLADHETDPARAALASFSLAKLYLSALAQPEQAAEHLQRALSQGLREPLTEEARARLVEALATMGSTASACAAAEVYRTRYPSGQRLSTIALSCASEPKPSSP